MVFAVEAWNITMPDDEEPSELEMVTSEEFASEQDARAWAWERMEEGFFVNLFRR